MRYTNIDNLDPNNPFVSEKNQIIVQDTLDNDGLHAVRHANGRDWWIVAPKLKSNLYYIILFDPSGFTVHTQFIGVPTWSEAGGELVFSPDGTKMARFNTRDDLRVFDFDRCTGTLSNPVYVPFQNAADIELFAGLAFSADNRYLYAADVRRVLQFDMTAPDWATSYDTVAVRMYDPTCSLSNSLTYMELAPDGRIFCRPVNGQRCMHMMEHPERAGAACDFRQNELRFDVSYNNFPHFPNFRLGPVDGSACDTLGLDNHPLAGWRHDGEGLAVDFISVSWYEPTAWYWEFGDGNTSTERNPAHTYAAPGAYDVCLTVSNANGADTKCKTVWVGTVSAGEPGSADGFWKVYPNPTTGEVRWNTPGPVTVRVFDALGQLKLMHDTSAQRLDLGHLPDGLYWVQWQAAGRGVVTETVVLMR